MAKYVRRHVFFPTATFQNGTFQTQFSRLATFQTFQFSRLYNFPDFRFPDLSSKLSRNICFHNITLRENTIPTLKDELLTTLQNVSGLFFYIITFQENLLTIVNDELLQNWKLFFQVLYPFTPAPAIGFLLTRGLAPLNPRTCSGPLATNPTSDLDPH